MRSENGRLKHLTLTLVDRRGHKKNEVVLTYLTVWTLNLTHIYYLSEKKGKQIIQTICAKTRQNIYLSVVFEKNK